MQTQTTFLSHLKLWPIRREENWDSSLHNTGAQILRDMEEQLCLAKHFLIYNFISK